MARHAGQFCTEDSEFSLPEGVDLVGIETPRKPSFPKSIRKNKVSTWRSSIKLAAINLFVCAIVVGYALIGSFVFLALEQGSRLGTTNVQVSASGYPMRKGGNVTMAIWNTIQGDVVQKLKADTVRNIWDITMNMNILYPDNWTRMTSEEVGNFQKFLIEKILTVVENATIQEVPYSWTFPRAFLFALTTLTTIGYGGIGPKTSSAKIATMIYAIFGIPLMLWYLSKVGSLLAKVARFLCGKVCCCCMCREGRGSATPSPSTSSHRLSDPYGFKEEEEEEEHTGSIGLISTVCVFLLLGYVFGGSVVVCRLEKWPFLDSFYFCFLTLTTISFGDVRSQRNGGLERLSLRTEWFCAFYIFFGMAFTAMFFNILHEEISRRMKRWKGPTDLHHHHHHFQGAIPDPPPPEAGSKKRRQVENSYSVHFMNFPPPTPSASRAFTEETLMSNEMHMNRVHSVDPPEKKSYEEPEPPTDYVLTHQIPPPKDIYGTHHVYPR